MEDQTRLALEKLLSVPLTTEEKGAEAHYRDALQHICRQLILDYDIAIASSEPQQPPRIFNMVEVEAYFKTSEQHHHVDPYTHAHPIQFKSGLWYFHHAGLHGFRGGTRKGMDVTIGNPESGAAGGILIRTLRDDKEGKLIHGPSLVVDAILEQLGHTQIKELVVSRFDDTKTKGVCWDKDSGITLVPKPKKSPSPTIVTESKDDTTLGTPRIGLSLKRKTTTTAFDQQLDYLTRPYRMIVWPYGRFAKGLPYTIVGLFSEGIPEYISFVNKGRLDCFKSEYELGMRRSAQVLKECARGNLDILQGTTGMRVRILSAALQHQRQIKGDPAPKQTGPFSLLTHYSLK
ncbi:hypothetical protein DM01DRAFT_1381986 [Hesseltinella vesiculosa]|uniref:Uncharacterized protein n=1 Tax=Hesseltinella vesiculosa TaxID=101127 RepID=A0A1X2GMQ1_9FUNG|nr:hypothetical protein DM01DRAFT_1381986 [Hesseltinella vesiculosa]